MSALRDAVEEYIAVRRVLGAKLHHAATVLRGFVDYLEREGAEFVTTELALRYAQASPKAQKATWAERLSVLRRFAMWRSVTDTRTEVPPYGLLPHRRRRKPPYVYSDEEVERLLDEAARLRSAAGLRGPTFTTLFGLLAATGLRLGEALSLDIADVNLSDGILTVRNTKFGKSRFVPVHRSTRQALADYARRRDQVLPQGAHGAFFLSERGKRVYHSMAEWTFARISCTIGLRAPAPRGLTGSGPRLHDLRHRFAAKRLIEWYRSGAEVECELPKLAAYLGHVHVRHTYWYIEAVPELLQLATDRLVNHHEVAQ